MQLNHELMECSPILYLHFGICRKRKSRLYKMSPSSTVVFTNPSVWNEITKGCEMYYRSRWHNLAKEVLRICKKVPSNFMMSWANEVCSQAFLNCTRNWPTLVTLAQLAGAGTSSSVVPFNIPGETRRKGWLNRWLWPGTSNLSGLVGEV